MLSRRIVIRSIVAALIGFTAGCAPTPSKLSDARQFEGGHFFYATLTKGQGNAVERLVPANGVVSRYAESKRRFVYVIRDSAVATEIARFEFKPLNKAEMQINLRRVSDINGRGVEENFGQIRVRQIAERKYNYDDMGGAFILLQKFAEDPWAAAQVETPEKWKQVADEIQVDSLEVGFVLEVEIELVTGNPLDPNDQQRLYHLTSRSSYRRATDKQP